MSYVLRAKCKYKADQTGSSHEFPCILTQSGILTSHVQYLYINRYKSQSWIEKSLFSVILLIKYIDANTSSLFEAQKVTGVELLRNFTVALNVGTIDKNGNDPSGLFWRIRSTQDAQVILNHITQYTDHISDINNSQIPVNRFTKASHVEEKLNWCSYYHRQAHVFLNHLENKKSIAEKMKWIRVVRSERPEVIANEKVARFPEDKIEVSWIQIISA